MRKLAFFVAGFFLALVMLSFFHFLGSFGMLMALGALLSMLFFLMPQTSVPLLVGFCVGFELLGTHRFGIVSIVGLILFGSYLLFAEQLRFTSPFARFIVSLLVALSGSSFLLYPQMGILTRIISICIVLILVGAASFLLKRASEPTAYELL